jgi:cell volume regulation protein A
LTTPWRSTRPVLASAAVLATLGVAISVVITAAIAHLVLGVEIRTALLMGAAVSSTDAAAVFAVLRRLPVPIHARFAHDWRRNLGSTTHR